MPALLLAIAVECIPLRDPYQGWHANYAVWVRYYIMNFAISVGLVFQIKQLVPSLTISTQRGILVAVVTAGCYILTMLLIAMYWVFPIPFGIVVSVIPFVVFFVIFFLLAIGREQFRANPHLSQELLHQVYIVVAQAILVLVYPCFNGVFLMLSPTEQACFVFVLPTIKLIMKNIVAWAASHLEDYLPGITVFSVEVFNALYVATCMQTAGSWITSAIIIGLDVIHATHAIYELILHTNAVHELKLRYNPKNNRQPLIATILEICQQSHIFKTNRSSSIRIQAPIPLRLSQKNSTILGQLVEHRSSVRSISRARPKYDKIHEVLNASSDRCSSFSTTIARVHPVTTEVQPFQTLSEPSSPAPGDLQDAKGTVPLSVAEQIQLMHETVKLLFHCEYIVLVEYVECVIPILYAIHMGTLFYLPSAVYYPYFKDLSSSSLWSTMLNLFVYALLEILSFFGVHFVLKWKFGFSPAYLLAFVLEEQSVEIQGRLFVWVIYVLGFTLEHFGMSSLLFCACVGDGSDLMLCAV